VIKNRSILIIGGQTLFREAMCKLLSGLFPHAVVFDVPNSENSSNKNIDEVDLMLLCMTPPYLTSLLALPKLRRRFPTSRILILSDVIDSRIVQMARIRGAHCFVHTSENTQYLIDSMLDTLAGKLIFPDIPESDGKQIRWSWQMNFKLSTRQAEVFDLLCKGMTNKEIGAKLLMTDNTVRTHVSALLKILEVRNRTEAVILGRSLL
jgi:DNA-binding NarL/FixJ family response regulator